MNLVFITEARYTKNKNGNIYYENSAFSYQLWQNYFSVFSKVIVVARVDYDEFHEEKSAYIASGENVKFIELPYFIGLKNYLKNFSKVKVKMQEILQVENAAYLCRVPGNIGHTAIKILLKNKKKYGVEVVGDPWDVFAPGIVKHPLRPIIRIKSFNRLKFDVKNASASLFVTEKYLQKRYPPALNTFTVGISDVILEEEDFYPPQLREEKVKSKKFTLISVGSLEQMYKSPDVLLRSVSKVRQKGYDVYLVWLGAGKYQQQMEALATELNIKNFVNFRGNVGKEELTAQLRNADLFALLSQTEGLPRAMVEAMAQSLPCIGTKVGGIPELLPPESLVDASDISAISQLIIKNIKDEDFYTKQFRQNFSKAKTFEKSKLDSKRQEFLSYLKNIK